MRFKIGDRAVVIVPNNQFHHNYGKICTIVGCRSPMYFQLLQVKFSSGYEDIYRFYSEYDLRKPTLKELIREANKK